MYKKLHKQSLAYLGHVITDCGLKPDPEKVWAIIDMTIQTDVKGIQHKWDGQLLVHVKVYATHSDMLALIWQLTLQDVPWSWTKVHEESFNRIKQQQAFFLRQGKQQRQYNKSAKDFPPLKTGDTGRLRPFILGQIKWQKGTVQWTSDRIFLSDEKQKMVL